MFSCSVVKSTASRLAISSLLIIGLVGCYGQIDWDNPDHVQQYLDHKYDLASVMLTPESDSESRRLLAFFNTRASFLESCPISKGVARRFVRGERDLLGIPRGVRAKFISQSSMSGANQGVTQVIFGTTIDGISLTGWDISLMVSPGCEIRGVSAITYVPTDALIAQLSNPNLLSEDEVTEAVFGSISSEIIAKHNLPAGIFDGIDINNFSGPFGQKILTAELKVTKEAPHVIWEVVGGRRYIVDAETGAILEEKDDVIIN